MRYFVAPICILLASCEIESIPFCEVCKDEDPAQQVPTQNVRRLQLLGTDRRLPAGAANVHFAERCGIDCSQWVRLDLPLAEAHSFAFEILGGVVLKRNFVPNGMNSQTSYVLRKWPQPWWPNAFAEGFLGGETSGQTYPPAALVLLPHGETATIWLYTFDL